jgi:hypothetical protein
MALDRHTLGRNSATIGSPLSTPPAHRFYSGSNSTSGSGMDDSKRAWTDGWSQTFTTPGPVTWDYFLLQIRSGRGATVFGRYLYMASRYKRSQSYNGPHAIYINEQLGDGQFWGYDPIVGYPIVYPYEVLKTYMESYNGFNGKVTSQYTKVTPNF